MLQIYKIITPVNVASSVCAAQGTGFSAGFIFSINGTLSNAANTVATHTGTAEQQVTVTTTGGDAGKIITVTGTNLNGVVIIEDVTLVSASSTNTVKTFTTVTSVIYKTGGTLIGNVSLGWTETGDVLTAPLPLNAFQSTFNVTLGMAPYPTASTDPTSNLATMEYSLDDPFDIETFPAANDDASWRSPSSLVDPDDSTLGLSAATDTALDGPVTMIRGVIQGSVSGGVQAWRYTIIQGQNT